MTFCVFSHGDKLIPLLDDIGRHGVEHHLARIFFHGHYDQTVLLPDLRTAPSDLPIMGEPSQTTISSILSSRLCLLVVISIKSSMAGLRIAIAILTPPRV